MISVQAANSLPPENACSVVIFLDRDISGSRYLAVYDRHRQPFASVPVGCVEVIWRNTGYREVSSSDGKDHARVPVCCMVIDSSRNIHAYHKGRSLK